MQLDIANHSFRKPIFIMAYELSIILSGTNGGKEHPVHWSFEIKDLSRPVPRFEDWDRDEPRTKRSWYTKLARREVITPVGPYRLASLSATQRQQAVGIISTQAMMRMYSLSRNCSNWMWGILLALEFERLVQPGTTDQWAPMLGRRPMNVAESIATARPGEDFETWARSNFRREEGW